MPIELDESLLYLSNLINFVLFGVFWDLWAGLIVCWPRVSRVQTSNEYVEIQSEFTHCLS